MTGRDLILYILENNLENEVVFKDGIFIGLISEEELAVKFDVGVSTIRVYNTVGLIKGITIKDKLYFLANVKNPVKKDDKND